MWLHEAEALSDLRETVDQAAAVVARVGAGLELELRRLRCTLEQLVREVTRGR